jgi:hypothetical protein
MRIIARSKIIDYYTDNPDAEVALKSGIIKQKERNGLALLT